MFVGIIMAPISESLFFLLFIECQPTLAFVHAQSENWYKKIWATPLGAPSHYDTLLSERDPQKCAPLRCMLDCETVDAARE
jgi:hypothetical protein